jgi:hypothetical protein
MKAKNKVAVALGKKGGMASLGKMSKKQLSKFGKKAAEIRWNNKKKPCTN